MTLLEAPCNALARVVAAPCELESGDTITGDILADLQRDLVGIVKRHHERRGALWATRMLELEGRAA